MNRVLWGNLARWLTWFALVLLAFFLLAAKIPPVKAAGGRVIDWGLPSSLVSACTGIIIGWLITYITAPRQGIEEALKGITDSLKVAYGDQLAAVCGSSPLPVKWAEGATVDGQGRGDGFNELHGFFRENKLSRLVILGEEGAGKSMLALQLAADILADNFLDRLPVVLNLTSWDLSDDLWKWIADELEREHAPLRAKAPQTTNGSRTSLAFLAASPVHVLPILDGFDTLEPKVRKKVLNKLNKLSVRDPLVLISRTKEYTATVKRGRGLDSAKVITLQPLNLQEVGVYLLRYTDEPAGRWDAVIDDLQRGQQGCLANIFATPAMVWLVRKVYEDGESVPSELLASHGRLREATVRDYLLDRLIDVVASETRWSPTSIRQWLGVLAQHATREDNEIRWWRLITMVDDGFTARAGRWGVTGISVVMAALLGLVLAGVPGVLLFTLLCGGVSWTIHHGFRKARWKQPRPARLGMPVMRSPGAFLRIGAAVIPAAIAGVELWLGSINWGQACEISIIIFIILGQVLAIPRDTRQGATPRAVLVGDRTLAVTRGFLIGPSVGGLFGCIMLYHQMVSSAVVMAIGFAFIGFYGTVSGTAWCQFITVRTWLAIHGLLPWRLMGFLEKAQSWGILRPVGAGYEFHSRTLQERLIALRPMPVDQNNRRLPTHSLADVASLR